MQTAAANTFRGIQSTSLTDIFDRESVFIETIVKPLISDMPRTLKIVLEHISTREAVDYVSSNDTPSNVAARLRVIIY